MKNENIRDERRNVGSPNIQFLESIFSLNDSLEKTIKGKLLQRYTLKASFVFTIFMNTKAYQE